MNSPWSTEIISAEQNLYCRIHKSYVRNLDTEPTVNEGAFYNTPRTGDNLSTDWEKYSTPDECRQRVGKQYKTGTQNFKDPEDYFVVSLNVNDILTAIPVKQEVKHDPIYNSPEQTGNLNNRAHSIIIGSKGDKSDPEIRMKFKEISKWEIAPQKP